MYRLTVCIAAAICLATGCGAGDDSSAELGGEAVAGQAGGEVDADVQGIPSGCGALQAVGDGLDVPPDEFFTDELMDEYLRILDDAEEVTRGESQATTEYLQITREIIDEARDGLDADSELYPFELSLALLEAAETRVAEIEVIEDEVIAYLDRRCNGLIDTTAGLIGSGPDGSGSRRPADDVGEEAQSMDGGTGDGGTGDDGTGDDGSQPGDGEPAADPEPVVAPVLEVETSSAGAIGSYVGLEVELGEVWRTNQEPREAIAGTGGGTDQSWVLVEVRLSSVEDTSLQVPVSAFRWLDGAGTATAAADGFTLQGDVWNPNIGAGTSERRYLVFPGDVGQTAGATLEIFAQGELAEPIPLGVGVTASTYPIELAAGSTGEAPLSLTGSCLFQIETEVRQAAVVLEALDEGSWKRAGAGMRLVQIDLGVFLEEKDVKPGCFASVPLHMVEARLQLSNGDVVAPTERNFDSVEVNSTGVDRLVFEIPEDVTSMTLVSAGETLGSWDGLELPTP